MGISEEIDNVEREFVPGRILFAAVGIKECLTEVQTASWFLRNIRLLDALPMYTFNAKVRNFHRVEIPWASDIFGDIVRGKSLAASWDEHKDGYEGGWLHSDLLDFFSKLGIAYPANEIRDAIAVKTMDHSSTIGKKSAPGLGQLLTFTKGRHTDIRICTNTKTDTKSKSYKQSAISDDAPPMSP